MLKSDLVIDRSVAAQPETASFSWKLFFANGTLARSFDQSIQGENVGWLTSGSPLIANTPGNAALFFAGYVQK